MDTACAGVAPPKPSMPKTTPAPTAAGKRSALWVKILACRPVPGTRLTELARADCPLFTPPSAYVPDTPHSTGVFPALFRCACLLRANLQGGSAVARQTGASSRHRSIFLCVLWH